MSKHCVPGDVYGMLEPQTLLARLPEDAPVVFAGD